MKNFVLVFLLLVFSLLVEAQKEWTIFSPDHTISIKLSNEDGALSYQVLSGRETVIRPSSLGIETSIGNFSTGLSFVNISSGKVDENYTMTIGKRKVNHAIANETSLVFKNESGNNVQIDLRAYNDGAAFRYHFPGKGKSITVTNETTQFAVPEGKVWVEKYAPPYEEVYADGIPAGTNSKDSSGWAFPALFQTANNWMLITEANLTRNYFASHLQQNSENGLYKLALPGSREAKGTGTTSATGSTPFSTPWRTIIVGKKLSTIVESNLVYHLSDPNVIGDVSWIKPGSASWSWWSDHASSKDLSKLKSFVDLAKEMGWKYSLVDANWNIMQGGTIEDLVKYAKEKNIGLIFWYNSGGPHNDVTEQPRDIMSDPQRRKEEFKKLREWGVKGVKVDFFESDKQNVIQLFHDILTDAAKEHIFVDFHGCTLPRGWSRTYPNLMSMEAVRGAENYGWSNDFAQLAPQQNNILTYTRNVVGPMDYTPVTFSDYDCCPHVTTNAQELALTVLFETGILHFADKAASYENLDQRIKDFMRTVPTTWDDTKFIQGEPGKETILARKSGRTWYVAGANGENIKKTIKLKLPFLSGKFKATIFSDGGTSREIKVSEAVAPKGQPINIDMLPNGGFIVVLKQ